ncbi:hypothetical protein ACFWMP_26110 [Paenibacillus sp. NPDC058367]|uniref:hypothetical protein n=1 Tax=Paenibacillus sp. NPDC058367 TaxID=3346460 RepID=UPI00365ECB7C
MICSRCKVETVHIDFPLKKYEVLGQNGQALVLAVDRCPCCGADFPSKRSVPVSDALSRAKDTNQPEQLMLFTSTVGGLQ